MSKRTKKAGPTGWMGARYGIRIRRRVVEIDKSRARPAACPRCSTTTLHRIAAGVYECRRCHTRFANAAYVFSAPPPITRTESATAGPLASGKA